MFLGCPGVVQRLSEVVRGRLFAAFGSCRKLSKVVTGILKVSQRYPSFVHEELLCQCNDIQMYSRGFPEVSHQVYQFCCSEASTRIFFN